MRGGVARTKGLQHHASEVGCVQYGCHYLLCDTREEFEYRYACVEAFIYMQPACGITHGLNQWTIVGDMYASARQRGVIVGVECREMLRIAFRSAVAAVQLAVHIDGHFGYNGFAFTVVCSGYLNGGQQVLFGIRTQYTYGQLTTGKDHGLA